MSRFNSVFFTLVVVLVYYCPGCRWAAACEGVVFSMTVDAVFDHAQTRI